jgi:hypothetical protein
MAEIFGGVFMGEILIDLRRGFERADTSDARTRFDRLVEATNRNGQLTK